MSAPVVWPAAWMPPEGERLPNNWHPRAEGYQRVSVTDEDLEAVFGNPIMVRHAFGSWAAYRRTHEAHSGRQLSSGRYTTKHTAVYVPWDRLDGRSYPTHLACILAVEFELANKEV